ncbi:MAG: hypothetical protein ABIN91_21080 [Mucilaginibacter sp.]|uniref:hypothetical protein n=1 Tax=Mucilaginibacter sp. TaxID=1882438 RepID=UPI00326405EA
MKNHFTKSLIIRASVLLSCIALMFIIHSCRKDISETLDVTNPEIQQAKTWYESTYPQNSTSIVKSPITTLSTGVHSTNGDMSQLIKPDWIHNATYNKLSKDVIEMPLDPSGKFSFSIKNTLKSYNKAYTRTSFLILKSGGKYQAYVMMIVADSTYVNNDLSKLSHNTYRKIDTDFSGIVMYFTPKGKFIRSYGYKNGYIIPFTDKKPSTTTQTTQGIKTFADQDPYTTVCQDWYWVTYDQYGDIFDVEFAFTVCEGGGDGGGSSNPNPCVLDTGTVNSIKTIVVTGMQDPIGDVPGDGPPEPPAAAPCYKLAPVKPCALKFTQITSEWMAVGIVNYNLGIQDNVFGTKFIKFDIEIGIPTYVSYASAQTATAAALLAAEATIANTHGVDFFLSAGAQVTYSKEFASLVQATLIAVLRAPGVKAKASISPGTPIIRYGTNPCD